MRFATSITTSSLAFILEATPALAQTNQMFVWAEVPMALWIGFALLVLLISAMFIFKSLYEPKYSLVKTSEDGDQNHRPIPTRYVRSGTQLSLIDSHFFLFDNSGKAVAANPVSVWLYSAQISVFQEEAKLRVDYLLNQDIRCLRVIDEEVEERTAVGKTLGRMIVSGLATQLVMGRPGAWAGGALLDYRISGKERRSTVSSSVLIVFKDFSTLTVRCEPQTMASLISNIPAAAQSDERAESTRAQVNALERILSDDARVCSQIEEEIASLRSRRASAERNSTKGKDFLQRDKARIKLTKLGEQIELYSVYLRAARHWFSLQSRDTGGNDAPDGAIPKPLLAPTIRTHVPDGELS